MKDLQDPTMNSQHNRNTNTVKDAMDEKDPLEFEKSKGMWFSLIFSVVWSTFRYLQTGDKHHSSDSSSIRHSGNTLSGHSHSGTIRHIAFIPYCHDHRLPPLSERGLFLKEAGVDDPQEGLVVDDP